MAKRFAGPGITALVGVGLQLTGWQDAGLGYALLGLAAAWAIALVAGPALVSGVASEVRRQLSEEMSQTSGELRIAVAQLCDELEYAKPILQDHDLDYFGRAKTLPMRWYDAHCATLARYGEMDAHGQVVRAYHSIDAVNRSFEEIPNGPEPELWINSQRADAAIPEIESAIDALRKINVG